MTIKNPEYFFKIGAEAMQSRIVAFLVMNGEIKLAPKVLGMGVPEFEEPEYIELKSIAQE